MRLVLGLTAVVASIVAIALALGAPRPAHAQGMGMNCYANTGGRSNCGLAINLLMRRLDVDSAERTAAEARHLQVVRGVDQAIKAGHCEEAVALARKSGDHLLSTSAARICAAQAPASGPGE